MKKNIIFGVIVLLLICFTAYIRMTVVDNWVNSSCVIKGASVITLGGEPKVAAILACVYIVEGADPSKLSTEEPENRVQI